MRDAEMIEGDRPADFMSTTAPYPQPSTCTQPNEQTVHDLNYPNHMDLFLRPVANSLGKDLVMPVQTTPMATEVEETI